MKYSLLLLPLLFFTGCETSHKTTPSVTRTKKAEPKPLVRKYSQLKVQDADYRSGKTRFKGFFAQPRAKKKYPALLVIPEYWGLTPDMKKKAKNFASYGYAVFVIDLYGGQKHTSQPGQAQSWLNQMEKSGQIFKNTMAAFEKLKSFPSVDASKVSLLGYTYGGALAVEMARRGYSFSAIVNIHGAVGSQRVAKRGKVRAPILWLKGSNDAYIRKKMEEKFRKEMKEASASVKIKTYEGAYNGFSNPMASKIGKKYQLPILYDSKTSKVAFQDTVEFLKKEVQ